MQSITCYKKAGEIHNIVLIPSDPDPLTDIDELFDNDVFGALTAMGDCASRPLYEIVYDREPGTHNDACASEGIEQTPKN